MFGHYRPGGKWNYYHLEELNIEALNLPLHANRVYGAICQQQYNPPITSCVTHQ